MKKITLILADDHRVLREGLKALLQEEEEFEVIGEAGTGAEACQLAERLRPDVMVLDLMMPDMNGIEVTRQIKKRLRGTHVVILSMHGSEGYVIEALRAGAEAYVLKESSSSELADAVRAVASGHRYLSPPLSERAIEVYTRSTEQATLEPYETLTARDREVLHMAAQGYTNGEIA
ncbi:MAG: response regulator transcription factor, partial [Dehalococcoidia bacterium]|nr:response regulator transcription factor [Dehalococcoidia bacterium]